MSTFHVSYKNAMDMALAYGLYSYAKFLLHMGKVRTVEYRKRTVSNRWELVEKVKITLPNRAQMYGTVLYCTPAQQNGLLHTLSLFPDGKKCAKIENLHGGFRVK